VNGLKAMNAGKPLTEFTDNPTPILDRLRNGESPSRIAATLGVSHQAVYEWLLTHHPEDWQAISASKSLARIEIAESDLDDYEADGVAIARARESARLAQWSLERVARRMYGDTKSDGGVTINLVLDRSCGERVALSTGSQVIDAQVLPNK